MIVQLALLADAANVSEKGKLNILGTFNRVTVRQFPAQHLCSYLVVVVEAHPSEAGDHEAHIVFVDENGERLLEFGGPLRVPEPDHKGKPVRTQLVLQLPPLPLPCEGDFSFDLLIDGRHEASIPLTARQAALGT